MPLQGIILECQSLWYCIFNFLRKKLYCKHLNSQKFWTMYLRVRYCLWLYFIFHGIMSQGLPGFCLKEKKNLSQSLKIHPQSLCFQKKTYSHNRGDLKANKAVLVLWASNSLNTRTHKCSHSAIMQIQTYLPKSEDLVEHVGAGSQVGWWWNILKVFLSRRYQIPKCCNNSLKHCILLMSFKTSLLHKTRTQDSYLQLWVHHHY